MPYIPKEERYPYEVYIQGLISQLSKVDQSKIEGHLNYILTRIVKGLVSVPSYRAINQAIGVLECVKQEFYRRVAIPYENQKIVDNGDVE